MLLGKRYNYENISHVIFCRALIQTLKDYGYVEHMGMGVKNKIIAGMLKHNGIESTFHAEETPA